VSARRLSRCNEVTKVPAVPLTRYFIFVGGALLALLFAADWYWQAPLPMPSYGSPIDKTILRIRSEHKWPQKIQFDTATPIIVLPTVTAAQTVGPPIATRPNERPALSAFAQVDPPRKQVAKRKPTRAKYKSPGHDGRVLFAVNPTPQEWPAGW
jgi:hypothetical protein